MSHRALCFVDMPFGTKKDPASGVKIDFDQIYEHAIKPAIEQTGLDPLRGDEERTGGIIHAPMFARLLLAEFVIADLTMANPNVFYELGIRHAARPFTTISIFANVHPLPFDVAMVRAISYTLQDGKLSTDAAEKLKKAIGQRLQAAIEGPAAKDSPLFQLIPEFPGIDLHHDLTEAFQDRIRHEDEFREILAIALSKPTNEEKKQALLAVQHTLGNLKAAQPTVLLNLMLSYRDVSAWDEMVQLCERLSDYLQDNTMVRQQWALALNRRNEHGDRDKAVNLLSKLLKERGPDPETLGILGRIHKDHYIELKAKKSIMASAALDDSIAAYTRGFESDPRDYYPGINAITLLIEKGDLAGAERLLPLVSFAVARRGGVASTDYWDLATVLELAAISNEWASARSVLPKLLSTAKASWMTKTTRDNLMLLRLARQRAGQDSLEFDQIIRAIEERTAELN